MGSATGYSPRTDAAIRPGYLSDVPEINRVLLVLSKGESELTSPTTFVAEVAGRIQGCAAIYSDWWSAYGWLANVAVEKDERRTGLGRRLVDACIERALDRELPEVWLETMFWNRRFYEKLGFVFVPVTQVPAAIVRRRRNPKCLMMRADLRERVLARRKTPSPAMPARASVYLEPV